MLEPIQQTASQSLPVGTLTFLLTDIEDSTRLWDLYPGQMRSAMVRHDELIEKAVSEHTGSIVRPRGEGDSRFAVFLGAVPAVKSAVAVQTSFAGEIWGIPVPIKVRIAVHTGEADLVEGDYYGTTVNRCARLRSAAHGGQVLISQITHDLVHESLPPDVGLRDLGEHKLKGLNRSEHIFQIIIEGLPSDFPPIMTQGRSLNNLPQSLTSFIGREKEIKEVTSILESRQLLTITGAGGSGKTRLALQIASQQNGRFADGIWLVDLTPLSNSDRIPHYVMNNLGIQEETCCPPIQTIQEALGRKSVLLILDNCEHVLDGAAKFVHSLLLGSPSLKIMATSRAPLDIAGETVWYIPPLSTPKREGGLTPEELIQYEAIKLFVDRAQAVKTDFRLAEINAGAVAEICTRLDGIPLAIELAAARVRVIPVEEIAVRLDDRFRLLVGSQNVIPRQKTLQNLIDWSHDLLEEKERLLFRRLSVFAGGWTLSASEKVCCGDGLESYEILDLLTHLLDKSLVIMDADSGGERYRFLETIRQYARIRLEESNEDQIFLLKHAEYFTQIAEQHYIDLWGPNQSHWLSCLDDENDNIREAFEWMEDHPETKELTLRLAGSLWRFWRIRGFLSEGLSRLEYALELNPDASDELRANGLRGLGKLALQLGDYKKAKEVTQESLDLFRKLDDKLGVGRELDVLGEIAHYQGDYLLASELHSESLALRYEIDDKEGIAVSLRQLGIIKRDRGDYQQAKDLLERSLQLCRELDDRILIAQTLNNLGLVEHPLCEYERATQLFEEAVAIYRILNDRMDLSNTLLNLANVAKDRGEFKKAKSIYDECLQMKKELGDQRGIALTLVNLSEVIFCQGNYLAADELAERSLLIFQERGIKRGINHAKSLLAFSAIYQGDFVKGRQLAEKSLILSTEINSPRAIAYSKELLGLVDFGQGNLDSALDYLAESRDIFQKFGDRRNVAMSLVNMARAAYRRGDHDRAKSYLEEGLSITRQLKILWVASFGFEIMGLLLRSEGQIVEAHEYFLDSLRISIDEENLQGIANCLGAMAGSATQNERLTQAVNLFAAADKLRQLIGAKMAPADQQEYENHLDKLRSLMNSEEFSQAWSDGLAMNIDQIFELASGLCRI